MRSFRGVFRPEEELLLLLLRRELDETDRNRVTKIAAGKPNWARFEQICNRFKLGHIIAFNLKTFGNKTVIPSGLLQQYNALLLSAVVRNEFWVLARELPSIISVFSESGVDAMLLKGPVVAMLNYSSPGLRLFGDLDFLVRANDLERAAESLMKAGFEVPQFRQDMLRTRREGDKTFPPLVRVNPSGQTMMLDLHWRLSGKFKSADARLWELARPHKLGKSSVLVPSVEHRLYHVCLHTAQHDFTREVWNGSYLTMQSVCDIDAIIRSDGGDLDWSEFHRVASFSGIEGYCYSYFRLAEVLLGTQVPREVLDGLRPGDGPDAHDWSTIAREFIRDRPDDVKRFAFTFMLRRDLKLSLRLRRFWGRCFPPVSSVARHYGVSERSWLKYLCYVRRLVRPSIVRKGLFLSFRLAQMLLRKVFSRRAS